MRELTVERQKSFVGCAVALKVYIEDPTSFDLMIGGVPCRRLGVLKNGQRAAFTIGEQAARVFVIADSVSRDYCSEFYPLPAGDTPVFLTGKTKFSPSTGNAFRFDGNDSPEVLAHRRAAGKKGAAVTWITIAACILAAFGASRITRLLTAPKAQQFQNAYFSITLTDDFAETQAEPFAAAYGSRDAAVLAMRNTFAEADIADLTPEGYARLSIDLNKLSSSPQQENGLTYYVYQSQPNDDGITYRYYAYVFKTTDAFWVIQFAADADRADRYAADFSAWASTVAFADGSAALPSGSSTL